MGGGAGGGEGALKLKKSAKQEIQYHMILWTIRVHSFSVYVKKSGKKKRKKVKPRTCVWRCIGKLGGHSN